MKLALQCLLLLFSIVEANIKIMAQRTIILNGSMEANGIYIPIYFGQGGFIGHYFGRLS